MSTEGGSVSLRDFVELKLDAIHADVIMLRDYQKAMNGRVADQATRAAEHSGDIKVLKALVGLIGLSVVPMLGVLMWLVDKIGR